ncbi:hypothetical protein BDN71DRAFT_1192455 [Pleurotus eryngii]|uniref:Heterokaryon incompatibility domain-containing protein n=1 Tax=Pleurotus eryngii TaxID=5323 RepID=A0A9P6A8N0_PLEER|nr:hypothetical protein BDN71DRAFT_1192455 [Pleurotus eryngii]
MKEGDPIRLESVKADFKERPRYCSLSHHRWGAAHLLMLTRETHPRLTAGIPTNELPQTFCDAVNISRNIGVRYLCIDSLFIFQDSKDDCPRKQRKCEESTRTQSATSLPRERTTAPLVILDQRLPSPRILHVARNKLYPECTAGITDETLCKGWDIRSHIKSSFSRSGEGISHFETTKEQTGQFSSNSMSSKVPETALQYWPSILGWLSPCRKTSSLRSVGSST